MYDPHDDGEERHGRTSETVMTAEKVATVKFDVENVVEKITTEMAKTIVVNQAERDVSSEKCEFDGLTAAEDTEEDECTVSSMKVDAFTFQWVPLTVRSVCLLTLAIKQPGSGGRRLR